MANSDEKTVPLISHAIVRFITHKTVEVIELKNIRQFKHELPKDEYDFQEKELYSGMLDGDQKYSPIEIFALGSEQKMQDKLNAEKRRRFRKFNTGDLEAHSREITKSDIEDQYEDTESENGHGKSDSSDMNDENERIEKDLKCNKQAKEIEKSKERNILKRKIDNVIKSNLTQNEKNLENEQISDLPKEVQDYVRKLESENRLLKTVQTELNTREKSAICSVSSQQNHGTFKNKKFVTSTPRSLFSTWDTDDAGNENLASPLDESPINDLSSLNTSRSQSSQLSGNDGGEGTFSAKQNSSMRKKKRFTDEQLCERVFGKDKEKVGEMKMFNIWIKVVERDIEMIHIGSDIHITKDMWNKAKKQPTASRFVKYLARVIWTGKLANRCITLTGIKQNECYGASPRKVVTPKKVKVIKQLLEYWLLEYRKDLIQNESLDSVIGKTTSIISEEISCQRKMLKSKAKAQNENNPVNNDEQE